MRYALGVDIGGTNIRIAVVSEDGEIVKVIKEATRKIDSPDSLVDQIIDLYHKIGKDYDVVGMGLGIPGPVKKDGTVLFLTNLGLFEPCNYKKLLEEKIDIPIYLGNDASVAGLAEAKVGAGKGYDIVQYLTLSTGIGGSLVINGKMLEGKNGMAQEVGNMIIKTNGRGDNITKAKGCIENEASGVNIKEKAREAGLNIKHAGELFTLAKEGNEIAINLKNEFVDNIAAFLLSIYCYIEPDIFVLGGGMMKSKEYFLDEVIQKVYDNYLTDYLRKEKAFKVVCAKYDQDCGIIGAAMLCF